MRSRKKTAQKAIALLFHTVYMRKAENTGRMSSSFIKAEGTLHPVTARCSVSSMIPLTLTPSQLYGTQSAYQKNVLITLAAKVDYLCKFVSIRIMEEGLLLDGKRDILKYCNTGRIARYREPASRIY